MRHGWMPLLAAALLLSGCLATDPNHRVQRQGTVEGKTPESFNRFVWEGQYWSSRNDPVVPFGTGTFTIKRQSTYTRYQGEFDQGSLVQGEVTLVNLSDNKVLVRGQLSRDGNSYDRYHAQLEYADAKQTRYQGQIRMDANANDPFPDAFPDFLDKRGNVGILSQQGQEVMRGLFTRCSTKRCQPHPIFGDRFYLLTQGQHHYPGGYALHGKFEWNPAQRRQQPKISDDTLWRLNLSIPNRLHYRTFTEQYYQHCVIDSPNSLLHGKRVAARSFDVLIPAAAGEPSYRLVGFWKRGCAPEQMQALESLFSGSEQATLFEQAVHDHSVLKAHLIEGAALFQGDKLLWAKAASPRDGEHWPNSYGVTDPNPYVNTNDAPGTLGNLRLLSPDAISTSHGPLIGRMSQCQQSFTLHGVTMHGVRNCDGKQHIAIGFGPLPPFDAPRAEQQWPRMVVFEGTLINGQPGPGRSLQFTFNREDIAIQTVAEIWRDGEPWSGPVKINEIFQYSHHFTNSVKTYYALRPKLVASFQRGVPHGNNHFCGDHIIDKGVQSVPCRHDQGRRIDARHLAANCQRIENHYARKVQRAQTNLANAKSAMAEDDIYDVKHYTDSAINAVADHQPNGAYQQNGCRFNNHAATNLLSQAKTLKRKAEAIDLARAQAREREQQADAKARAESQAAAASTAGMWANALASASADLGQFAAQVEQTNRDTQRLAANAQTAKQWQQVQQQNAAAQQARQQAQQQAQQQGGAVYRSTTVPVASNTGGASNNGGSDPSSSQDVRECFVVFAQRGQKQQQHFTVLAATNVYRMVVTQGASDAQSSAHSAHLKDSAKRHFANSGKLAPGYDYVAPYSAGGYCKRISEGGVNRADIQPALTKALQQANRGEQVEAVSAGSFQVRDFPL